MSKEILEVAKQIEKCIEALKVEGKRSIELITAKANTTANYDKQMGLSTATLKGQGEKATLIKDLAREKCSTVMYDKIIAEETLKSHYCRMDTLKAQLNGYQSIFRHLDNTG